MDLILLFFRKWGFASRLLVAVMRPIFSEIDDIYDSILFVIVKAVYILPLKHLHSLTYYLAYYLPLFLRATSQADMLACPFDYTSILRRFQCSYRIIYFSFPLPLEKNN